MHVLNVSQNYHINGGSDSYMFALEALLNEYEYKCIPFAAKSYKNLESSFDDFFPASFEDHPFPVNMFSYFYNHQAKSNLTDLLTTEHIDVAHLHIYYGKITSSILEVLRKRNIPIIQTLHEYKLACPVYTLERNGEICEKCIKDSTFNCVKNKCKDGSLGLSIMRYLEFHISRLLGDIEKIDMFISVSNFHRQKMIEAGIPSYKVITIHNFIDTNSYQPHYHHRDYALYFGRLENLKGIKTLINAAVESNTKLLIAGTGNDEIELKEYASKISTYNLIEFIGFASGEKLKNLIINCKYTILPSEWYENCPMSIIESKAYGKPVIGSNIGGIPELINDNQDGFLFEPKSTGDLVSKMTKLNNLKNYKEFCINARNDVENRFGKEQHFKTINDVYKKILNFKNDY